MAEDSGTKRRGVPLSVRMAPDMHAEVIARAAASGQSVTDEVNRLIAQAVAVENDAFMSPQQRHLARQLIMRYAWDDERFGGVRGVVYLLRSLEDPKTLATPDAAEIARRRKLIIEEVATWPESADDFFEWAANYLAVVAERRRAARTKPERGES